ncbi:MAG TPA: hypothetical protein VFK05_35475 [Polyangiaceae bacterium]|nr:hypothetical protein [Polyangiaceae bacterium]
MSAVERDPAELLERVPELARLASHPSVARAIERGRPHAVYRALFWLRRLGKAGQDGELIDGLLANRRLFIQPMSGAPAMVTFNGFGARPYGEAEVDPRDGSYIMTLYLVAIFVPIYPFSAYLVRPAQKGWSFFGKVPLSASGYVWQRAVALAGLVAVLFGGVKALGAMRYNTVQVVNGLSSPVEVKVGQEPPVVVAGNDVAKVRAKVGMQDVLVKLDGRVLEQGKLEVKRGYDIDAWNVLGAAVLFRSDVVYTAKDAKASASDQKEIQFLCGESTVLEDGIDFPFRTPPEQMTMGEHEKVAHRSHFDLLKVGPGACIFQLGRTDKMSEAKALARRLLPLEKYEYQFVARLVAFFNDNAERPFATELVSEGIKHHDSMIEYHRLYQGQALASGRRAALTAEYRERARVDPNSADAAYLLGRILSGAEADRFVSESQRRFPQHAYLLRSAAFRALSRADFVEVTRLVEQLRPIDSKLWQDSLDLELRALAALGKVEQARALARDCLKSPGLEPSSRFDLVVAGAQLAHFEPKTPAGGFLELLSGEEADDTDELRLHARVNACEPVEKLDLDGLDDKRLKAGLELELLARSDPKAALASVISSSDKSPAITSAAWALLLTEAARLDEHHAALPRLVRWSPAGEPAATALIEYALHGKLSDDLDDLDPELRAAADFVHSRAVPADSAESRALRDRAVREDCLHGPVSVAMATWRL